MLTWIPLRRQAKVPADRNRPNRPRHGAGRAAGAPASAPRCWRRWARCSWRPGTTGSRSTRSRNAPAVHRTTVYRRWGDVGRLLADVLDAASDDTWSPPDTGSLENDLTALNQEVYEALAGGGPNVTTALIAAGFRSAEAAAALSRFWEDRYARCAVVVTRAADRGELPGPADSRALLVAATAPLYHELLLLRTAPDPTLPRRAAAASAAAARTGAFEGANSSRDW